MKIKSIKIDTPIQEWWYADPRFSKDGIEGIIYPIIIRGPPNIEVEVEY